MKLLDKFEQSQIFELIDKSANFLFFAYIYNKKEKIINYVKVFARIFCFQHIIKFLVNLIQRASLHALFFSKFITNFFIHNKKKDNFEYANEK